MLPADFFGFSTSNPTLTYPILDNLSARDLIWFSRVSHAAYHAFRSYLRRVFDIQRVLLPFFSVAEIHAFRVLQADTGMLISGSTALQYFDRSSYGSTSDLDVYVDLGKHQAIGHRLVNFGYSFRPNKRQAATLTDAFLDLSQDYHPAAGPNAGLLDQEESYHMRGVAAVFNFERQNLKGETRKIQLVVAQNTAVEIILNFHSTVAMNIIGDKLAYSLYPLATLEERSSLICASAGPKQEDARTKYTQRGWCMIDGRRGLPASFPTGHRFFGDRDCWTIALSTPSPCVNNKSMDRLQAYGWTLDIDAAVGAQINFLVIYSPLLTYNYTIPQDDALRCIHLHILNLLAHELLQSGIWPTRLPARTAVRFADPLYPLLLKLSEAFYRCREQLIQTCTQAVTTAVWDILGHQ